MQEKFQQLTELLKKAQNVLIISHNRPDGDTTGSNLALRLHLESEGKTMTSACADELPENLKFLPKSETFTTEFLLEDFDTVIIVDAGAKHLVRFFEIYPELNRTKKPVISIDHHFSHETFGTLNVIDPEATSTTSLLYRYFKDQNVNITPEIATCLLNGIYTDTGSFMHSNTKPETMVASSELIKLGADYQAIAKNNFNKTPIKKLKMMGEILSNMQYDYKEQKIIAGVKKDLLERYQATSEDLAGVVDFINSVPEARYTVLYTEDNKGNVKASLRTRHDNVNVAEIAENYGGGGHSKAAGYRVPGRLNKQIAWQVQN